MRKIIIIYAWILTMTTYICAQTAVSIQQQAGTSYSKDDHHSLFLDQKYYSGFRKAEFVVEPEIFIHHTAERAFIGPGSFLFDNGDILMAAPWGRPPTNFEQLAAKFPVPMFYRSKDGGRTWNEEGRMKMAWNLPGMISDGGISFLRLKDGRLAFLAHRHVQDLKGGGLPIISFSEDDGKNWTPAKLVGEPEGIWYVMNDRLIQLSNGRLIVPVSHMTQGLGKSEGDHNLGLCFFSDDGGKTWEKSQKPADLNDGRGMAEPCVAETGNNQLVMLARTGSGSVFCSRSNDGGDTWSSPSPTTLVSACSSLTLKTLPDGRLIVFYNHAKPIKQGAFFPRTPLVYAVSEDKGMTWGEPVIIDDSGMDKKDRQNIYPTISFTKEGMLVIWSNHGADPGGSFAGQYDANIGGGKRAIIAMPAKTFPKNTSKSSLKSAQLSELAMPAEEHGKSYDIVVFGGTSGGVVSAVQAARMGKSVIIVEPGNHLGGMMASGLSWSDVGSAERAKLFGGLAREVFERIGKYYGQDPKTVYDVTVPMDAERAKSGVDFNRPPSLAFEPKVAEQVFMEMAREAGVVIRYGAHLKSVQKQGARLTQLTLEDGTFLKAQMFVDATYEGDLMAASGVSYTLGRESNDQYSETGNGVRGPSHGPASGRFIAPIDPYVKAGDPNSGLLPLISREKLAPLGSADKHIQSYNYRLCLTDDPALRVPLDPPSDFNPAHWELLGRYIVSLTNMGQKITLSSFCKYDPLPNRKFDFNNRWPISTDLLGGADGWPEGSKAERATIAKTHEDYLRGLFHFLRTDSRVPKNVREEASRFGLPRDEFPDNGHWPHQIYVREARRMVSDLVMNEHHIRNEFVAPNPVALATYPMDIHAVRRLFHDGKLFNEGFGEGFGKPAPIGYGAIVPKSSECENLFVTFALSSSHAAFGSIRMEPVFMVTSQSAATAASLAIDERVSVQQVNQLKLHTRLLADGTILENSMSQTTFPVASDLSNKGISDETLSHVIVPASEQWMRNGEASIIERRDGSLLLIYGAHQKNGDWDQGVIRQIHSTDGGKTWSAPKTVFFDEKRSLFQVSLVRLANGELGMTHTSLANGRDAFKVFRRSTDEGNSWSEPIKISSNLHPYTTGPWDKLYVLASGRVIALLHCNLKPDAIKQGGPLGSYAVYSDDNGHSWQQALASNVLYVSDNPTNKHEWGFWEPSLVEIMPGKLLMMARTATGWIWESRSKDNGNTWSKPKKTNIPNPLAPPVLTRIPGTDTLMLIHNPDVNLPESWHGGQRSVLAFRISTDGGRNWSSATDLFQSSDEQDWVDYPAVRWINRQLHLAWRQWRQDKYGGRSIYYHVLSSESTGRILKVVKNEDASSTNKSKVLRIMPLGDSVTRGTYLTKKEGQATGLPNPDGGGYRKPLQDKLRAAGIVFDFVGDLNYNAFGKDGIIDPGFDPDHHGLAGFGNYSILRGGVVPTPKDVLAEKKLEQIIVPGLVEVLKKHNPDIILLMSGANGFDATGRDELIRTIGENSQAHLLVATILPQKIPRNGWEQVDNYNASLQAVVDALQKAGKHITLIDMNKAISVENLMPDGVHPDKFAMGNMAEVWFESVIQELNTFKSLRPKNYKIKKTGL